MSKFDKIWIIPYNKAIVRLLFQLFGTEITILESFEFFKDTMTLLKNGLKHRNYSLKT